MVPHRKLRATPPGQRAIGQCRSRTTGQRTDVRANSDHRPLRRPARVPVGNFSKWAILHHFPNFYTLRIEFFRMFFIRSCLPMTPIKCEKFLGNRSARFGEIQKTDAHTHTQTDAATLYIYRKPVSMIRPDLTSDMIETECK